jgi:DNA-binding transcriptional LysR family regulator
MSAPLFVSGSDFVLSVPRRMADLAAAAGDLAVVDFPEANPFTYCVVWHERADMDAGLTWIRAQLKAAVRTVAQDNPGEHW